MDTWFCSGLEALKEALWAVWANSHRTATQIWGCDEGLLETLPIVVLLQVFGPIVNSVTAHYISWLFHRGQEKMLMRLERDRYAAKAPTGTAWDFVLFPRCFSSFTNHPGGILAKAAVTGWKQRMICSNAKVLCHRPFFCVEPGRS